MLPPTHWRLLRPAWMRILSAQRRQADRNSQSAGRRFTASLRLAEESLIGEPDPLLQRRAGAPAEFCQPADIEQLARRAVGPRGIEADLAGIADGRRDHAGEF